MIELFPNRQLRLRAAPPIIMGAVAVLLFVVKLPSARNTLLAALATLGLIALVEGLYLLFVSRSPTVILDGEGISVRSRIPFARNRWIAWSELRGGQTVRRQFIELATYKRPFRIWSEFVNDGPMTLFAALYEMDLHRQGIHPTQTASQNPAQRTQRSAD
jgi:hypothetical protein